jgi:hypothetical protein
VTDNHSGPEVRPGGGHLEPVPPPHRRLRDRADEPWERIGRIIGRTMTTLLFTLLGVILLVALVGLLGPVVRWALGLWGITW